VVVDAAPVELFLRKGDVEVVVEIASEGRHPLEVPTHALLVGQYLGKRRARNRNDGHVVMAEVLSGPVDVLGLKGTARTGGVPLRPVHQVMNDQLAAAIKEVGK